MNKKDKQYRWKDVTGECRPNVTCGSCGAWYLYNHKCGTLPIDVTCSGRTYRWRWAKCRGGPECEIRIERRVEVEQPKPEFTFTYTPEFVKALDCKNMSDESVLVHCANKWDEVIAAHKAGVHVPRTQVSSETCPACTVHAYSTGCPLWDGGHMTVCGNACFAKYDQYRSNPCVRTAAAACDYIQGKLDETHQQQRDQAQVDRPRHHYCAHLAGRVPLLDQ